MAIYSLHISTSGAGAGAKADYIEREGKYKGRGDLIAKGSQNLPSWAQSAADFWHECERQETGNQYREIKIALPKELDAEKQQKIVEDICRADLDGHALTWAIHENEGRLSGEKNPHAHIIFCERKRDPDRPEPAREQYFRRSSRTKSGEWRGGYAKDREITGARRKEWLRRVRESAEKIINRELQRAGLRERVSCRTLEEQGIDRPAQKHVGAQVVSLHRAGIDTDRLREWQAVKDNTAAINRTEREAAEARDAYIEAVAWERSHRVPTEEIERLYRKSWAEYYTEAKDQLLKANKDFQRILVDRDAGRYVSPQDAALQKRIYYEVVDGNEAKWIAAGKWARDEAFLQLQEIGYPPRPRPSGISREMIRQRMDGRETFSEEVWKQEQEKQRQQSRERARNRGRDWGMER